MTSINLLVFLLISILIGSTIGLAMIILYNQYQWSRRRGREKGEIHEKFENGDIQKGDLIMDGDNMKYVVREVLEDEEKIRLTGVDDADIRGHKITVLDFDSWDPSIGFLDRKDYTIQQTGDKIRFRYHLKETGRKQSISFIPPKIVE